MWTIQDQNTEEAVNESELLVGHIVAQGHHWVCRATGGTDGISLGDPDGLLHLAVQASGDERLPSAGESYVRGDEWKVAYPQSTGQFGLRMSLRTVAATSERLILEPTFSIQTSLLDTHPTLILKAVGGTTQTSSIRDESNGFDVATASIEFTGNAGRMVVLLGPHDAPFTANRSTEDTLELELFGEFLEKGVIRKARPWVILDRSDAGLDQSVLEKFAKSLCETPLPLTA